METNKKKQNARLTRGVFVGGWVSISLAQLLSNYFVITEVLYFLTLVCVVGFLITYLIEKDKI